MKVSRESLGGSIESKRMERRSDGGKARVGGYERKTCRKGLTGKCQEAV